MKYELTNISIEIDGKIIYKIKASMDFFCQDHKVSEGDIGGWVESKRNLSQDGNCWIFDDAIVCDDAIVKDNACVKNLAMIRERAIIHDNAQIYESAKVGGTSDIGGRAIVKGFAKLDGEVTVKDNVLIDGNSVIKCKADFSGESVISGFCSFINTTITCKNSIITNTIVNNIPVIFNSKSDVNTCCFSFKNIKKKKFKYPLVISNALITKSSDFKMEQLFQPDDVDINVPYIYSYPSRGSHSWKQVFITDEGLPDWNLKSSDMYHINILKNAIMGSRKNIKNKAFNLLFSLMQKTNATYIIAFSIENSDCKPGDDYSKKFSILKEMLSIAVLFKYWDKVSHSKSTNDYLENVLEKCKVNILKGKISQILL